jgi:hypothetical protein
LAGLRKHEGKLLLLLHLLKIECLLREAHRLVPSEINGN